MSQYFLNKPSNTLEANATTNELLNSKSFDFHTNMKEYEATPLFELNNLADKLGVANIFVKDESFRFGLNAFKGLGTTYALQQIIKQNPEAKTFAAVTDGNHGRALAWACKRYGKHSVVFLPLGTSQNRIEALRNEGANVLKVNGNYQATLEHAEQVCKEQNWVLLQDVAWQGYEEVPATIMAGYLTHFIELEKDLHQTDKPNVDVIFLQVGSGSWAASAAWYYLNKYGTNRPKIVLVEPEESNGMLTSFIAGKLQKPTGKLNTIMNGLNSGVPSSTAFQILQATADAVITIDDKASMLAMKTLFNPLGSDEKIVAGESGAAGLAGLWVVLNNPKYAEVKQYLNINSGSRVLLFNTEGATDNDSFISIIENNTVGLMFEH
jgi:diaminopropionate ammonia-lyase